MFEERAIAAEWFHQAIPPPDLQQRRGREVLVATTLGLEDGRLDLLSLG